MRSRPGDSPPGAVYRPIHERLLVTIAANAAKADRPPSETEAFWRDVVAEFIGSKGATPSPAAVYEAFRRAYPR